MLLVFEFCNYLIKWDDYVTHRALGCVLYELCALSPAFPGKNLANNFWHKVCDVDT